ncbi:MAG TPA: ASKHA domain-containing protein [Dehalococcoidia bacterium]|jgi:uncharacterized 2Fe-2S/4Fe-4S cluster protein (DUF4445 family)
MSKYEITFLPDGKKVQVDEGTTLFDAAEKAGVYLNSLCGGEGVCGNCRVQITGGQAKPDKGSLTFLSKEEIQSGYVLACQTKITDNLEVVIPPEARLEEEQILITTREQDREAWRQSPAIAYSEPGWISLHKVSKDPARLFEPLVTKVYLELEPPTIEDNIPDTGRIIRQLKKTLDYPAYEITLDCLKEIGQQLRRHDWNVTLSVARHDKFGQIIRIEGGDTTEKNYGVAVDVGTTTVVVQLVHLKTGQVMGVEGNHNLQAHYGEDVLSRIAFACGKGSLETLQQAAVRNINTLIRALVKAKNIDVSDVSCAVAAGNTTMSHLLLGLTPCSIRDDPYVPTVDLYPPISAADIGIEIAAGGILQVMPSVASYIGGDIVAGVLACGLSDSAETNCLIDVGTNGEIVIGNNQWMLSCSASAGPAFEGGDTKCGMRATRGAIQRLCIEDGRVTYDTIGRAKPRGIAGSGIVELLYELARNKIVDMDGKFRSGVRDKRLVKNNGRTEYIVAFSDDTATGQPLVITQTDIDNVMRSKAAVFAAIKSLVDYAGLKFEQLSKIYVAGGFGSYLDIEKAIGIGLIPDVPKDRIEFIGNSSLIGARMALVSYHAYEKAVRISQGITNIELSKYAPFADEYMAALYLPHIDHNLLFPSVNYGA